MKKRLISLLLALTLLIPCGLFTAAATGSEDGESVIVRLFNTHTESVKAELGLADIFKRAALTDLAENEQSVLSIADRKLVLTLGAKKIVTVALKTE